MGKRGGGVDCGNKEEEEEKRRREDIALSF